MRAEDGTLHDCSQRQIIEKVRQHFPDIRILVLPRTLIKEPIILGNGPRFMVSSQDGQSFFVSYLQAEKQADCFDGIISTVDIVSQEQIIRERDTAADFEQFHKVIELAMHVPADKNRRPYIDHICLILKYLST